MRNSTSTKASRSSKAGITKLLGVRYHNSWGNELPNNWTKHMDTTSDDQPNPAIAQTKQLRKELDSVLQNLRRDSDKDFTGTRPPQHPLRSSRERSLALTKIQEAIMWLGMDLKSIGESPNPYPHSYDPKSAVIDPTADELKM